MVSAVSLPPLPFKTIHLVLILKHMRRSYVCARSSQVEIESMNI